MSPLQAARAWSTPERRITGDRVLRWIAEGRVNARRVIVPGGRTYYDVLDSAPPPLSIAPIPYVPHKPKAPDLPALPAVDPFIEAQAAEAAPSAEVEAEPPPKRRATREEVPLVVEDTAAEEICPLCGEPVDPDDAVQEVVDGELRTVHAACASVD